MLPRNTRLLGMIQFQIGLQSYNNSWTWYQDKLKHDYIKQMLCPRRPGYGSLVITDVRDMSKNSGNPAFAHPNLCPETI